MAIKTINELQQETGREDFLNKIKVIGGNLAKQPEMVAPVVEKTAIESVQTKSDAPTLLKAIKQVESSGGIQTMGKSGETSPVQYMPETWKEHSAQYAKALGISPKSLKNDDTTKEKVAQWKIQTWIDQGYTDEQIAAAWNAGTVKAVSGEWKTNVGTNKFGVKYDTPAYVQKVISQLRPEQPVEEPVKTWENPIGKIPIIGQPLQKIGDIGAGIIQGTARFLPSVYQSIEKKLGGEATYEFEPSDTWLGKAQRIVFGSEPIGTVGKESEYLSSAIRTTGVEQEQAKKLGALSYLFLGTLDFTTGGGASKVIKEIIKASDVASATKVLKTIGASDDVASTLSKDIIKAKTIKQAETILARADEMQKALTGVKATPANISNYSKNLEPFIEQASKFKSYDEFGDYVEKNNEALGEELSSLFNRKISLKKFYNDSKYLMSDIERLGRKDVRGLEEELNTALSGANKTGKTIQEVLDDIGNEIAFSRFARKELDKETRALMSAEDLAKLDSGIPDWIPPRLRDKKLLNKVFDNIDQNTGKIIYPTGKTARKERELLDFIMDEADTRLGIKTSQIRELINNRYLKGEGLPPTTKIEKSIDEINQEFDTLSESQFQRMMREPTPKVEVNKIKDLPTITPKTIRGTREFKDWLNYADKNFVTVDKYGNEVFKDIPKPNIEHPVTLTAERVAEMYDGGIGGRVYREIIKPAYDSAVRTQVKLRHFKLRTEQYLKGIIEGGSSDSRAFSYAENKLPKGVVATAEEVKFANYARETFEKLFGEVNKVRAKVGLEPMEYRGDYVPHMIERNIINEFTGNADQALKGRIKDLETELAVRHPDWETERIKIAAKRELDKFSGLEKYIKPNTPIFNQAKKRLKEESDRKSLVRALSTYYVDATNFIEKAEVISKNKAYIEMFPANARKFLNQWNIENVAGVSGDWVITSNWLKDGIRTINSSIGSNTILGNLSTMGLQLSSFAQTIASAGLRNTLFGYAKRMKTYLGDQTGMYDLSRSKVLRNLDIDIGTRGNTIFDQVLDLTAKIDSAKDPIAKSKFVIQRGKKFMEAAMREFDQFTAGAAFEAFHKKGLKQGLSPVDAIDYADIMVGKTQANYFKEGMPLFQNTIEGQTFGQFGTYMFNQWEYLTKDLGKDFMYGGKSVSNPATKLRNFTKFVVAAYVADQLTGMATGREPYAVKNLVDSTVGVATGNKKMDKLVAAIKDEPLSYLPFMGSMKFGSLPPAPELGKDLLVAITGSGAEQTKAFNDLKNKWTWNLALPYGGTQIRKTLEALEANNRIDLPMVSNPTKTAKNKTRYKVRGNIEKLKAMLFGLSSTEAAKKYYEGK